MLCTPLDACQCRRHGFDPWGRKIPWSRKWQPTPAFLPGKFHGQRSLVGYSPCSQKESDTSKQLNTLAQKNLHHASVFMWNICTCISMVLVAQLFLILCNPMECSICNLCMSLYNLHDSWKGIWKTDSKIAAQTRGLEVWEEGKFPFVLHTLFCLLSYSC